MSTHTADIHTWNLDDVRKGHQRLVRRAAKLGVSAPTITIGAPERHEARDPATGFIYTWTTHPVTIDTPEPIVIAGWALVAVIDIDPATDEATSGASRIIHFAPGTRDETENPLWRTLPDTHCDHCGRKQHRIRLVALRNTDTADEMVIGVSCSRDFIGHDLAALLNWCVALHDIHTVGDDDDYFELGRPSRAMPDTHSYVACASRSVELHGYTKTTGDGIPTRDDAWNFIRADDEYYRHNAPTKANAAEASAAIEWAQALPDNSGDFNANLRAAALRHEVKPGKTDGILAYLPVAYRRHTAAVLEAEARAATENAAGWFGEVGKRSTFTATITDVKVFETIYGASAWVKMVTDEGHALQWKASGADRAPKQGARVTAKGTVKEHTEWRGEKVTTITRMACTA